uniref:Protein kinase domain-containing protein n=1 Tax=Euplotes crassus TaxID=5936 RepID=A0A7S3NSD3_EUPCR|mmetsp:Transcript_1573/g.1539  ORF Transcript_1573/g.1539 Transcript_1573/m.1539 type:complete len:412 (+) Transcript_1573:11-1246(+)|eukprot:CAMPEP_0197007336 /NCGR_PEP_ID=MMETSP1380-20130617/40175_1 /TAXON_ID=5936 /ORGANISM="Euplotes crassus, Strain CT5" /LENGTH=411 /DNA_ID=CAMNT_0042427369 /DNA_START=5 /DNA_END=1240 /DNA_ORIENTATION=+
MSQSDSDSDTPVDINDLRLPTITHKSESIDEDSKKTCPDAASSNQNEDGKLEANNHEESKEPSPEESKKLGAKSDKFQKFRAETKDLISKTEKKKQLYMQSASIDKALEGFETAESSATLPNDLEVNDPRFKYNIILSKGYKLLKKMGNGAYASVFLAEKVSDPTQKCILKISIGEERIPDTQNEYEIMKSLDSHRIPKVYELIIDNDYYYSIICMEYSEIDTNVLQFVNKYGSLAENQTKQAMKELFEALKYIHSLDYAHRDVKPDNVLIKAHEGENEEHNVSIGLVDYNIAKKAKSYRNTSYEEGKEEISKFRCNYLTHIASQNSQAPELFKSGYYSESVDIWGAGLVFFTLMTGTKIKRGDQEMIKEQISSLENISDNGRDLLHQLFEFEGESRPTAEEALEHAWFVE